MAKLTEEAFALLDTNTVIKTEHGMFIRQSDPIGGFFGWTQIDGHCAECNAYYRDGEGGSVLLPGEKNWTMIPLWDYFRSIEVIAMPVRRPLRKEA